MPVFAVQYAYVDRPEALDEVRPRHRAYLADLLAQGTLLASGPYRSGQGMSWSDGGGQDGGGLDGGGLDGGGPGALLLVRAESAQAAAELLEADPFNVAGLIERRGVRGWVPVMGPFSDEPGV